MFSDEVLRTYGTVLFGSPADRESYAETRRRWAREDNEAMSGVLLFLLAFVLILGGIVGGLALLFG